MPEVPRSRVAAEQPDPEFWGPVDPAADHPYGPPRPAQWGGPLERTMDRFRDLRTDPKFGIVALLVMALVAGFVWYRMGVSSSTAEPSAPVEPAPGGSTAKPIAAATTTTPARQDVTVHVAGAVVSPGVYELPGASRVIDAVEAAGGGAPEAELDRLNLASKLADGQRILVQRAGEPVVAPPVAGTVETGAAQGEGSVATGPIDLNAATQLQLEALPGIGPTLAQAIIAERDRRGGFRSVNELRSVRGIGDQRFADLQPLVTV
jgi:competence protein ComEA